MQCLCHCYYYCCCCCCCSGCNYTAAAGSATAPSAGASWLTQNSAALSVGQHTFLLPPYTLNIQPQVLLLLLLLPMLLSVTHPKALTCSGAALPVGAAHLPAAPTHPKHLFTTAAAAALRVPPPITHLPLSSIVRWGSTPSCFPHTPKPSITAAAAAAANAAQCAPPSITHLPLSSTVCWGSTPSCCLHTPHQVVPLMHSCCLGLGWDWGWGWDLELPWGWDLG
jgi:hypothetical protein